MMTRDGSTINRESARHKFGGDPMAEYLWRLSLDSSFLDEDTGDVYSSIGWCARFGKRILHVDDVGFVDCVRYASADDAILAFGMLQDEYDIWSDEEIDSDDGMAQIDALRANNLPTWRQLQQRRQARYPRG